MHKTNSEKIPYRCIYRDVCVHIYICLYVCIYLSAYVYIYIFMSRPCQVRAPPHPFPTVLEMWEAIKKTSCGKYSGVQGSLTGQARCKHFVVETTSLVSRIHWCLFTFCKRIFEGKATCRLHRNGVSIRKYYIERLRSSPRLYPLVKLVPVPVCFWMSFYKDDTSFFLLNLYILWGWGAVLHGDLSIIIYYKET
jgi:hypothetical protein